MSLTATPGPSRAGLLSAPVGKAITAPSWAVCPTNSRRVSMAVSVQALISYTENFTAGQHSLFQVALQIRAAEGLVRHHFLENELTGLQKACNGCPGHAPTEWLILQPEPDPHDPGRVPESGSCLRIQFHEAEDEAESGILLLPKRGE